MSKESPSKHRTTIAFRLRDAAGKSQEEAAAIVHVNARTWQRYESEQKEIPEGVVHLFCLETKLDYLTFRRLHEETRAMVARSRKD